MAVEIDPGSDARSLATNAISTMSNSVFGNIVGPVFSADLLSLLGLGGADEVGDYLNKIQSELEQMQGELVKLQQSVDQILAGIVVIEEKFTDVEASWPSCIRTPRMKVTGFLRLTSTVGSRRSWISR